MYDICVRYDNNNKNKVKTFLYEKKNIQNVRFNFYFVFISLHLSVVCYKNFEITYRYNKNLLKCGFL